MYTHSVRSTFDTTRRKGLLVGVGLFGVFAAGAAQAQWTGQQADLQIGFDDDEYSYGVQLIVDEPTLTLHAFWQEDSPTDREILYGVSTDGGVVWSSANADRVISFPDGNDSYQEVAAAIGVDGTLLVAWSENLNATREVHYGISFDGGATFDSETQDQVLSDPTTAVNTLIPSVAIDREGNMHAVWGQSNGNTAEVHYSRSTDDGATWSGTSGDRYISFDDGNGAIDPKIVVGDEDRLIVIWKENVDGGGRSLHVGISDDGGDTWSSETADREISQPVNLMTAIDVAGPTFETGGADVYAVYGGSFDESSPFHYETYVTSSDDNGDTWTGESTTTAVSFDEDHTRSASNCDVYQSCLGPVVAWNEEEDVAGTSEIHFSRFTGSGWTGATEDIVISFPDGEDGYRPSIASFPAMVILPGGGTAENGLFVAWTEFSGSSTDNYDVHLSAHPSCAVVSVESGIPASSLTLTAGPNPAYGSVRFELAVPPDHGDVLQFEVFESSGRRHSASSVVREGDTPFSWEWRTGEAESRGVYYARARIGGEVVTKTIVIAER